MKRILIFMLAILLIAGCSPQNTSPSVPPVSDSVQETPDVPEVPAIPQTVTVTLRYPDKDFLELRQELRTITITDKGAEWDVLDALYAGPQSNELIPVLGGTPADILSVTTADGLCTVDLSDAFVLQNTGGSTREGFILSSIASALCSLDGIEQVKFNVEGNTAAEYGGHFTLDEPFSPIG